jgi:tRNA (guanine-N7-)-methyltransferase
MQRGHLFGDDSASATPHRRGVRSFVLRGGRITDAQQRALAELWPRYGIDYRPAPLDLDAIFGRHAPRVCEIGFGNGEHLAALAAAHPERDHLGIEVHRPGVGRLLLALSQLDIGNVRVICEDAVQVLEHQIPPAALDEVMILFPDPWPKKRHHKRRLIQPEFVEVVGTRLAPRGVLRLATDWQPYAEQMLEVLSAAPAFRNASPQGTFAPRPSERAATRFERRGERLGHGVWDLVFIRN